MWFGCCLRSLLGRLDAVDAASAERDAASAERDARVFALQELVVALQDSSAAAATTTSVRVGALEQSVVALQDSFATASAESRNDADALRRFVEWFAVTVNSSVGSSVGELGLRLRVLERQATDPESGFGALTDTLEDAKKLAKVAGNLLVDTVELDARVGALQESVVALQESATTATTTSAERDTRVGALQESVVALQESAATATATSADRDTRVGALEQSVVALQESLATASAESNALRRFVELFAGVVGSSVGRSVPVESTRLGVAATNQASFGALVDLTQENNDPNHTSAALNQTTTTRRSAKKPNARGTSRVGKLEGGAAKSDIKPERGPLVPVCKVYIPEDVYWNAGPGVTTEVSGATGWLFRMHSHTNDDGHTKDTHCYIHCATGLVFKGMPNAEKFVALDRGLYTVERPKYTDLIDADLQGWKKLVTPKDAVFNPRAASVQLGKGLSFASATVAKAFVAKLNTKPPGIN